MLKIKILFIIIIILCTSIRIQAETTIVAQIVKNQTGSGSTFISSGFPFPPGLVSESSITDGKIKVIVEGAEIAANISALRGRHSDGTIRSALIQFTVANMAEDDILTASVIVDGSVRTYADPDYVRPTWTHVQNNNVILPTDPDYIVTTFITFEGLLVEGNGTAEEEKQYSDLAEYMFDKLVITQNTGTANYEEVRGMVALWARTGDIKFFNQANYYIQTWIEYNTPASGLAKDCRVDQIVNPDSRPVTHGHCGLPAEWTFSRMFSYASMYLLTGYRDFWSIVAYNVQFQQFSITDQSIANSTIISRSKYGHPRFNYSRYYGGLIAAYMIDATIPINGQWFSGRAFNWGNQLEWTLNAIKEQEWDIEWIPFDSGNGSVPEPGVTITQSSVTSTLLSVSETKSHPLLHTDDAFPASGYLMITDRSGGHYSAGALTGVSASAKEKQERDYRNGLVGLRSNGTTAGPSPVFQLSFPSNFLIDYYLYVKQDIRIPAMVKKNLDVWLTNISLLVPGDRGYGDTSGTWGDTLWGNPYSLTNPAATGKSPWVLPHTVPRMIAFVLKTLGEDTVNGASYATWYSRCVDSANNYALTYQWKLFGQFYGFGHDTAWIMAQTYLPHPTYREPTYYASIPGDTPLVKRIRSKLFE